MYSLTIHFGPNAVCWAFLFKDEEQAGTVYNSYMDFKVSEAKDGMLMINDSFGQTAALPFSEIRGILLEDLEAVETARIQRSLAEERCKVKLMNAAKTDPVIGPAMRGPAAQVLAPNFRQ